MVWFDDRPGVDVVSVPAFADCGDCATRGVFRRKKLAEGPAMELDSGNDLRSDVVSSLREVDKRESSPREF
jgi:hypothetical protein